jgi:hypothetical protein
MAEEEAALRDVRQQLLRGKGRVLYALPRAPTGINSSLQQVASIWRFNYYYTSYKHKHLYEQQER